MRLIDADELNKVKFHELPYTHIVPADLLKHQTEAYERGWNDAIDAIVESADTIDAVLVVRCKDCKYRKVSEYHYKGIGYCTTECTRGNEGVIGIYGDSGYCPDGERKAEP